MEILLAILFCIISVPAYWAVGRSFKCIERHEVANGTKSIGLLTLCVLYPIYIPMILMHKNLRDSLDRKDYFALGYSYIYWFILVWLFTD